MTYLLKLGLSLRHGGEVGVVYALLNLEARWSSNSWSVVAVESSRSRGDKDVALGRPFLSASDCRLSTTLNFQQTLRAREL
jgi:hypothetical protein